MITLLPNDFVQLMSKIIKHEHIVWSANGATRGLWWLHFYPVNLTYEGICGGLGEVNINDTIPT